MSTNGIRGLVRRTKHHELIAIGRGLKRCKRCDVLRRELDDGAVRWRLADGRELIDPPRCTPKSGDTRSQSTEACRV